MLRIVGVMTCDAGEQLLGRTLLVVQKVAVFQRFLAECRQLRVARRVDRDADAIGLIDVRGLGILADKIVIHIRIGFGIGRMRLGFGTGRVHIDQIKQVHFLVFFHFKRLFHSAVFRQNPSRSVHL